MKYILLIILSILFCSCSEEEPTIATESEKINTLVNATDIQKLNLDSYSVDTVYAKRFIDFRSLELEREGVFISNVLSLKSTDTFFYTISRKAPFIVQFDNKGNLIKKIGEMGKGPAEYLQIKKAAQNKEHFYLMDSENARINIHDNEMNYLSTFSKDNIVYALHTSDMFVSEDHIFFQNIDGNDNSVRVVSTDSAHQNISTFLPRLIPPGMQPKPVNSFFGDVNREGNIAIAYLGLPYILFYDTDYVAANTIVLESTDFEGKIPSLEPKPDNGSGIGVKVIISSMKWISDLHLSIINKNVVTILQKSEGRFQVQGRYKVEYADEEEAKKNQYGLNLRVIDFDDNFMYSTSSFDNGVYRVPLSKMGL